MAQAIDLAWTEQITSRLANAPLPGRAAQIRFMPQWAQNRHFEKVPSDATPAAVAILLCPSNDEISWFLPLITRPHSMKHHGGQICLPGGSNEPGESSVETALREMHEEIGVDRSDVELLGQLTPLYVFVSRFIVTPVVFACSDPQIAFTPNADEVDSLLPVPLKDLKDPANQTFHVRENDGRRYQVPHFQWQEHQVWGATSMILSEFLAVLE